ncbi:MAG: hypothetical protein OXG04_01800 [Acidobacteria bacterium]|nr:hypothetical protein [Acidobacteriota bacterium]
MPEWLSITIVLALGGILVRIGMWIQKIDGRLGALETIKTSFENFKDGMLEFKGEVLARLPPASVSSGSPMRLTALGQQISKKLQLTEWAAELASDLALEVEDKRPFELDEFSDDYVHAELDDSWKARIAECAYDFGIREDSVLAVLKIVLRDALIDLRPKKDKGQ